MAIAEFTQGQSIQRRDPVTGKEGHLEDTGGIWVSWYSWARLSCCSFDTPSCCAGLCQAGWQREDSLGPDSSERRAVGSKPSVWMALTRPSCASKNWAYNARRTSDSPLLSSNREKGRETGPEGSQRTCPPFPPGDGSLV